MTKMSEESPILGIDFGNLFSCAAVIDGDDDEVRVIYDDDGFYSMASFVYFKDIDDWITGNTAKAISFRNRNCGIYDIKRIIAGNYDEDIKYLYKIINKDEKSFVKIQCQNGEKELSFEEICAKVLNKLKIRSETLLKKEINKAVITVPYYYKENQKKVLINAGKKAGLDVLSTPEEAIVAILSFGLDKKYKNSKIVVFDFGATCTVSLVEIYSGAAGIIASKCLDLGGDAIDLRIANLMIKKFKKNHGFDILREYAYDKAAEKAFRRILNKAEMVKIYLSGTETVDIDLHNLYKGKDLECTVSRDEFDNICMDIFEKTLECVKEILSKTGTNICYVEEVLLIGGSTKIPYVRKMLKTYFKKEVTTSYNAEEAVAIGAAKFANNLSYIIENDVSKKPVNKNLPTKSSQLEHPEDSKNENTLRFLPTLTYKSENKNKENVNHLNTKSVNQLEDKNNVKKQDTYRLPPKSTYRLEENESIKQENVKSLPSKSDRQLEEQKYTKQEHASRFPPQSEDQSEDNKGKEQENVSRLPNKSTTPLEEQKYAKQEYASRLPPKSAYQSEDNKEKEQEKVSRLPNKSTAPLEEQKYVKQEHASRLAPKSAYQSEDNKGKEQENMSRLPSKSILQIEERKYAKHEHASCLPPKSAYQSEHNKGKEQEKVSHLPTKSIPQLEEQKYAKQEHASRLPPKSAYQSEDNNGMKQENVSRFPNKPTPQLGNQKDANQEKSYRLPSNSFYQPEDNKDIKENVNRAPVKSTHQVGDKVDPIQKNAHSSPPKSTIVTYNKCPVSLGIFYNGHFDVIVPHNSNVMEPFSKHYFVTGASIQFDIYGREGAMGSKNNFLKSLCLEGLIPMEHMTVELIFFVTEKGMLTVEGKQMGTNIENIAFIDLNIYLNQISVDELTRTDELNKKEDEENKNLILMKSKLRDACHKIIEKLQKSDSVTVANKEAISIHCNNVLKELECNCSLNSNDLGVRINYLNKYYKLI